MSGRELCELLDWDSYHFGIRVNATRLTRADARSLPDWMRERDVACPYLLLDARCFYQALDFTPTRVEVWLHLWRDELAHTKT